MEENKSPPRGEIDLFRAEYNKTKIVLKYFLFDELLFSTTTASAANHYLKAEKIIVDVDQRWPTCGACALRGALAT